MAQLGAMVSKTMSGTLQNQTITDTSLNAKQILAAIPAATSVTFLLPQSMDVVDLPSSMFRKWEVCFKSFLSFNHGFISLELMWVK